MTRRYLSSEVVLKTQLSRLRASSSKMNGATFKSPYSGEEDVAGNCLEPKFRLMEGRAEAMTRTRVVTKQNASRAMGFYVRCRKCENCLDAHAYHWRQRAKWEHLSAHRTWMGTLTLDPEVLDRAKTIASVTLREKSVSWDDLTPRERFAELDKLMYREFQKRVDLLRKTSKVPFRYLAITEVHQGGGSHHGEPHWHVLMHETDPSKPFRYDPDWSGYEWNSELKAKQRVRDPFWLAGFQKWNLKRKPGDEGYDARKDDPTYVCKYLAKDIAARVRASKYYGAGSERLTPPQEVVTR